MYLAEKTPHVAYTCIELCPAVQSIISLTESFVEDLSHTVFAESTVVIFFADKL